MQFIAAQSSYRRVGTEVMVVTVVTIVIVVNNKLFFSHQTFFFIKKEVKKNCDNKKIMKNSNFDIIHILKL